jgi:ribose/xylose/arabinose/galactoside ABC-type transport system permease subunit
VLGLNLLDDDPHERSCRRTSARISPPVGVVDRNAEFVAAEKYRKDCASRRPASTRASVKLSGGNQQKVVLAQVAVHRARAADPRRAHARHRRRGQVRDLRHHERPRRQGKAIMMISSELPELLGTCATASTPSAPASSPAASIVVPEDFQKIANGYLPEIGGKNMPYHLITVVLTVIAIAVFAWAELTNRRALKKYGMPQSPMWTSVMKIVIVGGVIALFGMLLASYKGIPVVGLILFGLVLIYTFVTQRTVLGRHIYAVGGNANAARLSGVDTRRVSFFVMVNMGLLAGIAGMVFTAYLNAANPKDGTGFELDAIAAVFIGGAAVAGGVGKVSGAMIGGFVMGVLNLGLANLSVDSNWIQIIKGLVLLSAVAFDVMSKVRGKPSFIAMIMNAFTKDPSSTAQQSPVRADEASGPSAVQNVASSHQDDVPEGIDSKVSITDSPIHGSEHE